MPRIVLYFYNFLLVPCLFTVFSNVTIQCILVYAHEDLWNVSLRPSLKRLEVDTLLGNSTAYTFAAMVISWAFIWMKWLPGRVVKRPVTKSLEVEPSFCGNGHSYYVFTFTFVLSIFAGSPGVAGIIHDNIRSILGFMSLLSGLLYFSLYAKARLTPGLKTENISVVYEYYRGMERHPCLFGVDVKQFSIFRVGMTSWLIVTLAFLFAGWHRRGFLDCGHFACVVLQVVYIYKTFAMEPAFEAILNDFFDRAGHDVIWGGIVWIPAFYSWNSYIYANVETNCTWPRTAITLFLGLTSIYINYQVLHQKISIKQGKPCIIWAKVAKVIKATNINLHNDQEKVTTDYLLCSGWWGKARKLSCTTEITIALAVALPGYNLGWKPFLLVLQMMLITAHRIVKDEEKCKRKYGQHWNEYCKRVPYRLIPYIF